MDDATLLEVLHATATAIADALGDLDDWGLAGTTRTSTATTWRPTPPPWRSSTRPGSGVLSEESGTTTLEREVTWWW